MINKETFKSDRKFVLFDALISHGQLLLRSQKSESYNTNIDIIFFGISYIQLFTVMSGIEVTIIENFDLIQYKSVSDILAYKNHVLFKIKSKDEAYYITANYMRVFENELEFHESSLGFDNMGREKELFRLL